MFGAIEEKLILGGVAVLAALFLVLYLEHRGAEACVANVEKSNVAEEKKEDTQHGKDAATVKKEGEAYETAKSGPMAPAPVITLGVCPDIHHKTGPSAPAPGAGTDGEAALRATDPGLPAAVEWNTEPVVRVGHEDDAQIAGLQDYITNVCRPEKVAAP